MSEKNVGSENNYWFKKNLGQKKFGSINIYLVQKNLNPKKTFGKFDNMSLLDLEGD